MLTQLASYQVVADNQWHGPWHGGPGWWLVFPILFWVLVLSVIGRIAYHRSPGRSARSSAEQILAERFARGEIDAEELQQRRNALRHKA